jgi:hypothetical protein
MLRKQFLIVIAPKLHTFRDYFSRNKSCRFNYEEEFLRNEIFTYSLIKFNYLNYIFDGFFLFFYLKSL